MVGCNQKDNPEEYIRRGGWARYINKWKWKALRRWTFGKHQDSGTSEKGGSIAIFKRLG